MGQVVLHLDLKVQFEVGPQAEQYQSLQDLQVPAGESVLPGPHHEEGLSSNQPPGVYNLPWLQSCHLRRQDAMGAVMAFSSSVIFFTISFHF